MSDQKPAPKSRRTTDWTPAGYRLVIEEWPDAMLLTCETQGLALPQSEKFNFYLGRVVILNASLRPQAEGFAKHAFSFYDAALGEAAGDAVQKLFDSLQEREVGGGGQPSTPPRGVN